MMKKSIDDFHTSFYIPSIQKLAFHLPYVRILGTHNCGKTRHEALKHCRVFQDMLCCRYYSEIVVASFSQQIKSE